MIMTPEIVTAELRGMYRDVVRAADGQLLWDSQWQKNAIVFDCRRLLAAFVRGGAAGPPQPNVKPPAFGIRGIRVGSGSESWDETTSSASAADKDLVDPRPYFLPREDIDFQIDFLDPATSAVTATATNKLQIVAKFGPGKPDWPKDQHLSSTLREFGLVGQIEQTLVLINYVRHPAIAKDPQSTLERTIWLTF